MPTAPPPILTALQKGRIVREQVSSAATVHALTLMVLATLLVLVPLTIDAGLAPNGTSGSTMSENPLNAANGTAPPSPTGLTGTRDTNYNMHLSWPSVPGATSYVVSLQVQASGVTSIPWTDLATVTGTSYTDTTFNTHAFNATTPGVYRYHVRAVDNTGASTTSADFPQPSYAVIDLGTVDTFNPVAINDLGSVISHLNGSFIAQPDSFWGEGTFNTIPSSSLYNTNNFHINPQNCLDNHDNVVGVVQQTNTPEQYCADQVGIWQGTNLFNVITSPPALTESAIPVSPSVGDFQGYIASKDSIILMLKAASNEDFILSVFPSDNGTVAANLTRTTLAYNYMDGAVAYQTEGQAATCNNLIGSSSDFSALGGICFFEGGYLGTGSYTSPDDDSGGGASFEWTNSIVALPTTSEAMICAMAGNGTVLCDYTNSPGSTSYEGFQTLTGQPTKIINTSDIPAGASYTINNNGEILGLDKNSNLTNWNMVPSSPPVNLTNAFAGPWNNLHQIIGSGMSARLQNLASPAPYVWNSGLIQGLTDLLPDSSPWVIQSVAAINDSGAIVGTATYSGTNTAIPAGSHGVMLWPLPKYFIDSALTQTLDDFPATSTLLRSPKHIFAQGDNIYIQAKGPPGLGNSAVTVTVTSDSDTTGISVPLAEVSPGVYEDQSPALPLQLGPTTGTVSTGGTASAYTIKVMDKEVLKFNFNLNGIKFTGSDVMVLRGKFAACGIDMFYAASGGDQAPLQSQAIGSAKFFSAGNTDYPDNQSASGNPMATFVLNAGDGSDGQAVWMHVSSHGVPDGDIADANSSGSFTYTGPTATINGTSYVHNSTTFVGGKIISPGSIDTSANWNKDLEWVVLASCDQLNVDGGGFAAWQPILSGSPRSIHGILGAYNELSGNLQDQINEFWNGMQSTSDPEYVIDAYGTAMEEADSTAQPYAILFNQNNTYDQLKTVTRDSAPSSGFLYLNVDTVIGGRVGEPSDTPVTATIDNGNGLVRTTWPTVSGSNIPGAKKLSAPTDFTRIKHLAFAKKIKKAADGKQAFLGKTITETLHNQTALSKQQASEMATVYLSQQFPEFASRLKLKAVSERVSGTLSANGNASSSTDGYLVQFSVLSSGIPVWGNFVNVSVQGNTIEAVHFLCDEAGQSTAQGTVQPLDGSASLATALPDIKNALNIKSQYEVFKAELFYVNQSTLQGSVPNLANDFIPAWRFIINRSYKGNGSTRDLHEVWVDATTGKLLAHERY